MSDRVCYNCVLATAASTGRAALGDQDGFGKCATCGATRHLYRVTQISRVEPSDAAVIAEINDYRARKYAPEVRASGFGWALVMMALALVIAVLLTARCASSAQTAPTLEEWTVKAIHRLPVFYEDRKAGNAVELTPEKAAQLHTLAVEVARVSARDRKPPLPPRRWAALILTVGFHESTFSLRIHRGACKPHECDRGKARGPFQQQENMYTRPVWDRMTGIENTRVQVEAVDSFLRRHVMTCPSPRQADDITPVEGILTGYAGRRCGSRWKGLDERVATFWKVSRQ